MTREEILKLEAGPGTNALIAIWVFEWEYDSDWDCLVPPGHPKPPLWVDGEMKNAVAGVSYCGDKPVVKDYTGDIAAAWEVVDEVIFKTEYRIAKMIYIKDDCSFYFWNENRLGRGALADTAPLSICRAALLAVMETE